MASKTPTYGKDLPANLGTDGVLRAIYDKIQNGAISGDIDEKLDTICDQLVAVNNSIESNTQAIKDISINIDVHTKDIQSITTAINKQTKAIENIQIHIDTSDLSDSVQLVAAKVENGFVKTVEAIKSIQPGPTPPVPPRPVPPYPPHPCPESEPIFYPVTIGLPEPIVCYRPKKKRCKCECKCECHHYNKHKQPKVIVPKDEDDWYHRPHNPYLEPWKIEYYKSLHNLSKPRAPKRVNCQY